MNYMDESELETQEYAHMAPKSTRIVAWVAGAILFWSVMLYLYFR